MSINDPIRKNQITSRNKIEQQEHCDEAHARRVKVVDELGNPINGGNPFPVDAIINFSEAKPDTQEIFQVNVTTANVEFSQELPTGTEIINMAVVQKPGSHRAIRMQYTFNIGESGTNFRTVKPGNSKTIEGLSLKIADRTIYFRLNNIEVGGTIVEIETWGT